MLNFAATMKLAWIAWVAASAAVKKRDAAGKPKIFDPNNKRPVFDVIRDAVHDALVAYDGNPGPSKAA